MPEIRSLRPRAPIDPARAGCEQVPSTRKSGLAPGREIRYTGCRVADEDYKARFGGIARLYGQAGLARLRSARVAVIGLGGVGSWAVEALARSGVGSLTLVDLDDICITNVNRQLHALDGTIGREKAAVLADRVRAIHPGSKVEVATEFFTSSSAERILAPGFDWVVDAIDQLGNKCLLIAECRRRNLRLVVSGGAGGRRDPTAIRIQDLAQTSHDPLLAQVRSKLRKEHRFSADPAASYGIPCVYTRELPVFPAPDGTICAVRPADRPPGESPRLACDSGLGAATFVTGAFGFASASVVVQALAEDFR
ncbi:MAG TPA: tRNA cyclic N6-threonylcarbamoyladenosine(37) synthase TcdA [Verrucomicrobiales bacterium]|nr:tRNA cyclic N6-threonylcarbamoyladenosine(37) synthase TcdA [Verrucomicrobiales bacterium]